MGYSSKANVTVLTMMQRFTKNVNTESEIIFKHSWNNLLFCARTNALSSDKILIPSIAIFIA